MKTFTSTKLAAAVAGLVSLASVATAQNLCAIECFQSVITEHPPLDCTEPNMYLCFCKSTSLQNYFAECVWSSCGDDADESIQFGVNLCRELGAPIDPPVRPSTTTSSSAPSTTDSPPESSDDSAPTPSNGPSESESESEPTGTSGSPSQPSASEPGQTESSSPSDHPSSFSSAPAPTGNSTAPPHDDDDTPTPSPSHVEVNMGMAMNAAPGLLAAAGLAVAALQL